MRLGVVTTLRTVRDTVDLAAAADRAGFWGFGAADTAPALYPAAYPTLAWALERTERIHLGPMVTNPITQHWSVHASTARTFEEMGPGRSFLGVATGDGAVHPVGLRPAKWETVEETVRKVREYAPKSGVHVAAAGPKGAEAAGRVATDLVSSLGFDSTALRDHVTRARAARHAAGIAEPLRLWVKVPLCIVDHEGDVKSARVQLHAFANGIANSNYTTFTGKNVPERWQPIITERLAAYDFGYHGVMGENAPNARLFEDHPELQDYLLDRLILIGTREQCLRRIEWLRDEAGVDGVWFSIIPNPVATDPLVTVQKAAEAFGQFLDIA